MGRAKDEEDGGGEGAAPEKDEDGERSASEAPVAQDAKPGPNWHRRLALAVAAAVLFPVLAKSGIWDPYELDAADLARRIALHVFHAPSLEVPGAINVMPTLTDLRMGELPFTSMAVGFKLFGLHDWTGRLPLALWGFAGVAVLYELLARLIDRRAGLYAAIALVTMPLYFMQARTMLGDVVAMSALTMAFSGLAGAMLAERGRLPWLGVGSVGLVSGYLSRGMILGVAVPTLAIGLTWLALRASGVEDLGAAAAPAEGKGAYRQRPATAARPGEGEGLVEEGDAVGAAALVIGLLALGLGLRALFSATPEAPLSRAVGFLIQRKPGVEDSFDLIIRQLGHALFPWSAFLPFALGRLFRAPVEAPAGARGRETGLRAAILIGAAVAYGAYALLTPRSGALPFAAPALLAAAVGLAIFDFERGAPSSKAIVVGTLLLGVVIFADLYREQEKALAAFVVDKPQFPRTFEEPGKSALMIAFAGFVGITGLAWLEPEQPKNWGEDLIRGYREGVVELGRIWNGNLVFGMVVVEAALVGLGGMVFVGRRLAWAPVMTLPKLPADVFVNVWWILPIVLTLLPGTLVVGRDMFRAIVEGTRIPRASFTAVAAVIFSGGMLGFGYYPGLAAQLSPKEAFESYSHLAKPGEPLALLSVRSRAAAYYGGGESPSFTDATRAFAWLTERPGERRWMLLKADDLPRLNSLFRSQAHRNLPILDGRSSQILLASNELGGHPDESWLASMVLDDPPKPAMGLDAVFEDQLAAFGWEVKDKNGRLMDTVVPATTYHLRVYYRVLKPITGNWKAFVHIDGNQRRYNGDHNVLDGKYAMNLWHPGDVIVDDFEFQLEPNFGPGGYTVYFGFFSGDNRFKVTKGQNNENRVVAGTLEVR
jgi:hypothetical protein